MGAAAASSQCAAQDVVFAALRALGAIAQKGNTEAVRALLGQLKHGNAHVRRATAQPFDSAALSLVEVAVRCVCMYLSLRDVGVGVEPV